MNSGLHFFSHFFLNFSETWGAAISSNFQPPKYRTIRGFSSSYFMVICVKDYGQITKNPRIQNRINKINLSFIEINVGEADCSTDRLVIYDGPSVISPRIAQICGDTPPLDWIVSTGPEMSFELVSNSNVNTVYFLANYVADHNGLGTSSLSCGLTSTPCRLSADSMYFSDGTEASLPMRNNQNCSWIVQPITQPVKITLAFERFRMLDSNITIYDGTDSTKGDLLWSCNSCKHFPSSLNAFSGSMFVMFESGSDSSKINKGGFSVSKKKETTLECKIYC